MRRVAPLAAALVLAACSGDSGDSSQVRGQTPDLAARDGVVYAVQSRGRGSELVSLEARRLRVLPGRVPLGSGDGLWTRSPDQSSVAFGGAERRRVRIVGLRPLARRGEVRVGGLVMALAWVAPRRILAIVQTGCCPPVLRAVAVDPVARRVVASRLLGRGWTVAAAERRGRGLVLLLSRATSIDVTRLVVLDARARSRRTGLYGIRTGQQTLGRYRGLSVTEFRTPGLVLDPNGRRALVFVGPPPLVAEVDLRTLAVRHHRLQPAQGRLARFLAWLDPPAHAGGGFSLGGHRRGEWLDGGLVALTGYDDRIDRSARQPRQLLDPVGIRIVDTRRWTMRTAEPRTTALARTGDRVVAWGGGGGDGPALVGYGLDGREQFRVVRLPSAPDLQFAWPYAYRGLAGPERLHRVDVIDLRTGALVGRGEVRGTVTLLGDHEQLCWCW